MNSDGKKHVRKFHNLIILRADYITDYIGTLKQKMDLVEQKFNNFKQFLLQIAPEVQEIKLFAALVPLDMFLDTAYMRVVTEGATVDELIDRICAKVNVSKESFSSEVIAKFTRYVEYFIDIAKELHMD